MSTRRVNIVSNKFLNIQNINQNVVIIKYCQQFAIECIYIYMSYNLFFESCFFIFAFNFIVRVYFEFSCLVRIASRTRFASAVEL